MRLSDNERDMIYKEIRCKLDEGHKKEHIVSHINKKYNTTYKVGSWKYLHKMATKGLDLQAKQEMYNQYMEKVKDELKDKPKEDKLNSEYAEHIFAVANKEIDEI